MIIVRPISLTNDQIKSIARSIPLVIELHRIFKPEQPLEKQVFCYMKIVYLISSLIFFGCMSASQEPYWNNDYVVIWYIPIEKHGEASTIQKPCRKIISMQGDYQDKVLDTLVDLRKNNNKIVKVMNVNHTLSTTFIGGKDNQ